MVLLLVQMARLVQLVVTHQLIQVQVVVLVQLQLVTQIRVEHMRLVVRVLDIQVLLVHQTMAQMVQLVVLHLNIAKQPTTIYK